MIRFCSSSDDNNNSRRFHVIRLLNYQYKILYGGDGGGIISLLCLVLRRSICDHPVRPLFFFALHNHVYLIISVERSGEQCSFVRDK